VKAPLVEGCINGIGHIMAEHHFNAVSKLSARNSIYKALKHFLDTKFALEKTDSNRETYKGPQIGK